MRSHVQESSSTFAVKKGIIKKVMATIILSFTVLVILLASAWNSLEYFEMKYSEEMRQNQSQQCDVVTKINEECSISTGDSTSIVMEPGESIHINNCYADGDLWGEYEIENGEIYYIEFDDVTAEKQIVMN